MASDDIAASLTTGLANCMPEVERDTLRGISGDIVGKRLCKTVTRSLPSARYTPERNDQSRSSKNEHELE